MKISLFKTAYCAATAAVIAVPATLAVKSSHYLLVGAKQEKMIAAKYDSLMNVENTAFIRSANTIPFDEAVKIYDKNQKALWAARKTALKAARW